MRNEYPSIPGFSDIDLNKITELTDSLDNGITIEIQES